MVAVVFLVVAGLSGCYGDATNDAWYFWVIIRVLLGVLNIVRWMIWCY